MENSIEKATSAIDKISAVLLAIKGHSVDKKQVVVVEGDDDAAFYSRFVDETTCDIIVNNSCFAYPEISENCNKKGYANRYFLIKDADFDRLVGSTSVDNQLLTDYHDKEMFLSTLDIDTLLQTKYGVIINTKSISSSIRTLSFTKWYNMAMGLKLSFKKKCTLPKVYDGENDIDIQKCIMQLSADPKNTGKTIMAAEEIETFGSSNNAADWRQYTNGHDWFQAIALWMNKKQKKIYSYKVDILPYLESAYQMSDFSGTGLCHDMEAREIAIGRKILL